ncbi:MAG: tandem-95 repeat protein [Planctomycetia bacterium]|nr:tandem-95 repeat protein [Planctomycetia bacterium]
MGSRRQRNVRDAWPVTDFRRLAIADVARPKGTATGAIAFTIGDTETAPGSLTLSAASSNTGVVTNVPGSFTFGGSGANRTLIVTPVANGVGTTTITITVTDGNGETALRAFQVRFNAPPTVTPTVANLTYDEQEGPKLLDGAVQVADTDGAGTLTGATVTLTILDTGAEDLLFTDQGTILGSSSINAGTLTLTLSGTATLAQYQTALRSIQYQNTSENPSAANRTIGFQVNDGLNLSAIGTRTLVVAAVNDAPVLAGAIDFTAINEDVTSGANTGTLVSALIAGQITDADGTGVAKGIAVTGATTTNGTWEYRTTNAGTWTAFGALSDSTALLLLSNSEMRVRFVPNLNFNGTVTPGLTFRAWDTTSGTAGTTADASTNGDATAFSVDTASASITVNAVNDAPDLTGVNNLTAIDEDVTTAANTGTLVSALIAGQVTDADGVGVAKGIAVTGTTTTNGTWEYRTTNAGTWTTFGSVSDTTARLLLADAEMRVRFVPNLNYNGTVTPGLTFRAWDATTGTAGGIGNASTNGNATAFSSTTASASILVNAVNDLPVVTTTGGTTAYVEGDTALVIDAGITLVDVDDTDLQSATVTITNYAGVEDQLVFANNFGITGGYSAGTLTLTGPTTKANFLLALRSVKYHNGSDKPTEGDRTISFTLNDGDGNGPAATKTVSVAAVNDVPVLSPTGPDLIYQKNDGEKVIDATITITDPDNDFLYGAVITLTNRKTNDSLTFTNQNGISGVATAPGSTYVITLSGTATRAEYEAALQSVKFQNSGGTPNTADRIVTFGVSDRAIDKVIDSVLVSRTIQVGPNQVPVVSIPNPPIVYTEGDGSVAIASGITTVTDGDDPNIKGATISLTLPPLVTNEDVLEFTNTPEITGALSTAGGKLILTLTGNATKDQYRDAIKSITYRNTSDKPQTQNRTLTFTVTDGEDTSAADTRTITITAVNDAPILTGTNNLTAINEDVTTGANTGTLVSALISGTNVTDPDGASVAKGIAVTGTTSANGTWEYRTTNAGTWTAFGVVSDAAARLLLADSEMRVRFVPNANFNGVITPGLTFRAWDATTGTPGGVGVATLNGGTTAYSVDTASASITVNAVNDAPVLAGANNLTAIDEDVTTAANTGTLVSALIAGQVSDIDGVGVAKGIAVTGATTTNGTWEFRTTDAGTWTAFGSVSDAAARLLLSDSEMRVRFVPNLNYNGTVTPGLTFRAWDTTSGTAGGVGDASATGGTTAYSTAAFSASVTVNPINDAPVLTGANSLTAINEDVTSAANTGTLVSALISGQVTDADGVGVAKGIAVTGATTTNGSWEYRTTNAGTWTAFGALSDSTALLLLSDSEMRVRFVPNLNFNGTVTPGLTFRAWDTTSGTAGNTADASTNGGTTAFSIATASASILVNSVNDAPVVTTTGIATIYNENAAPVVIDSGVSVSDVDVGATVSSATIKIRPDTYAGIQDQLSFVNQNGISGIYSAGTLTLTGTTSIANYILALQSITYSNTSQNPTGGDRTIVFTVNDGFVDSAAASQIVTVNPINDAPTISYPPPTSITILQTVTSGTFAFTIGDVDNDPATLTMIGTSNAQGIIADGGIVFGGSGTSRNVKFTPVGGAFGHVEITLTVRDASGATNFVKLNVDVNNPPSFVTAPSGSTINEDAGGVAFVVSVTDAETAPNLGMLDVTATSNNQTLVKDSDIFVYNFNGPSSGARTILALTAPNLSGDVIITIKVKDPGGSFVTTDYLLHINPVNDQPTAAAGLGITTLEDTPKAVVLAGNDGDDDFVQTLTYTIINPPVHGVLEFVSNGNYKYRPAANYAGTDSFTFVVTDDATAGGGPLTSSLAIFSITVDPVADAPTFPVGFTISGKENTPFASGLVISLTDTDGSEEITSVKIEGVIPQVQLRGSDGVTLIAPTATDMSGIKTYVLTWAQFLGMTIYADDNLDTKFKITATSTEVGTALGYTYRNASTVKDIDVDVINVPPEITKLFASNVDAAASTSLTSVINDAPKDYFSVLITWGISKTGFPQQTFLPHVLPGTALAQAFTFLIAPDPSNAAAPIKIEVTAIDKDGGVSTSDVTIEVPGTGIPTPIVRDLGIIDTPSLLRAYIIPETPEVRTTIPTAPTAINDRRAVAQQVAAVERTVELRKVSRGVEASTGYRLKLAVLDDLPEFLKTLPDGHYRLYLKENDFTMPRMLADVIMFRGLAVSPGDLQADRPPKQFRLPSSEVQNVPPIAKTPAATDNSSNASPEERDGAGPGIVGPNLSVPPQGVRGVGSPAASTPEFNELRGPVP